jgi:hypothetical protein
MLGDMEFPIPVIEFGEYCGGSAVVPVIALASCECSEKERIIRLDAYSLSVSFDVPAVPESEYFSYAYCAAVWKAFEDNPTLGGIVDRAIVTGKKYVQPKKSNCGDGWGVVITLRITTEEMHNVC